MNKLGILLMLTVLIAFTPAMLADDDDERSALGTLFDPCDDEESGCDPRLGVECGVCDDDEGLCLCRDDRTLCSDERGGVCVDLQQDPNHCGGCNTVCGEGQVCVDGSCAAACQTTSVDAVFKASCEELTPGDGPCSEFFVDTGAGSFNCSEDPLFPGICVEGEVCLLAPNKPGCQVVFKNRSTGVFGAAIDCSSRCASAAVCRNFCDNHAAARNAVVTSCTCEQNVCSSYPKPK